MAFDVTAVAIGDSTKQADYSRLMANTVYNRTLKEIVAKSANYTILDTDTFYIANVTAGASDKTITLPTAADNSARVIKIMKVDGGAGSVIVDGEGAETINGTTTWEITEQYGYIEVQCDGTEWFVINKNNCCIYEVTNSTDYGLTDAYTDIYSLAGLTPGAYKIYFGFTGKTNDSTLNATIATAVDTEDSALYRVYIASQVVGDFVAYGSKEFTRSFTVATTLYLNAKESVGDVASIINSFGHGIIRAERIG